MQENNIKGILIPVGGNEDKGKDDREGYTVDFVTDGILAHVVRCAGGNNANIVVVTSASSIPEEVGPNYIEAFRHLDCENVKTLHVTDKSEANSQEVVDLIAKADCVMFSGGDQSKIVDYIGETRMHQLLIDRYHNEQFVIAGTSAGAMCMSSEMIYGGSAADSLVKGAVLMREGMRFAPGLIIDSHFIQRGRFGRLSEAVSRFPHLLGVGLAEDTGMIIEKGRDVCVIGSGMVILIDPSNLVHNRQEILEPGTPMTLTNLTMHVLSNSDGFDIATREITVLPIDADFV